MKSIRWLAKLNRWPIAVARRAGAAMLVAALMVALHAAVGWAQGPPGPRCDWTGQSYTDFYSPADFGTLNLVNLGDILRVEHLATFPPEAVAAAAGLETSDFGAEAYRILYASLGAEGTLQMPQAVSGLLVVPTGSPPAEGFPVLVHGHGTTGIADQCAPSQTANSPAALDRLLPWVARGYLVSAPDYAGLGPPEPHPYAIGAVAGYSMLDGARAALNFCDSAHGIRPTAANRIFLEGHSQGGHSALFAHQLWPAHAPELNVLGTVAFAPGAELRYLAAQTAESPWSMRIAPMALAMLAYRRYYQSPPDLSAWLQPPFATDLSIHADNQCVIDLALWLGLRPDTVFQPDFLSAVQQGDWEAVQPWTGYMDANTPGNFASDAPVLVLQGDLDPLVPPEASVQLTRRLCDNGTAVKLNRYAGLGHSSITRLTLPDALTWMDARLAGQPPVDSCAGDGPPRDPGLRRTLEPVIITGADAIDFFGAPVDELAVLAYRDGVWQTIPAQVDELTITGAFTATENDILDNNDQIVFMAGDMGDPAPFGETPAGALWPGSGWYEIAATDPTSPTLKGWAYLVRLTDAAGRASADYVDFDPLTRRISGQTYGLGFPPLRPGADYLRLGDGPDILDRTKVYLDCTLPVVCPFTENQLPLTDNHHAVKDGPVRAILHHGQVLAYGSMVVWARPYTIPIGMNASVRVSTDFNPAAENATFFNLAAPAGALVDGLPDDVPPDPASAWWQLSTDTGSVVQVTDIGGIGGTPSNFYRDDATAIDPADTGDGLHFGETGLHFAYPNRRFTHRTALYFLPDRQPNVGQSYAAFFQQPLVVTTTLHQPGESGAPGAKSVYLPLVLKIPVQDKVFGPQMDTDFHR